ncbi:hemagglutinin repeat-containing protein [Halopseudomonas pachastrellae]|nr:hemagglutinin repeat-containing protein [Halopseudomonas pachastrellae]
MQAGGNLINQGAVIQAGGDVELGAGQDLIVSATEERSLAIRQDRRHYWESSAVTQHGSEVSAGGDLNASAGNDLAVVASQLEAGEDLTLSAQGDLVIAAAANEQHSEYRYRRSDKKVTREDSEIAQQGAQLLSGADVTLLAGDSLTAVASRIEAAQQAYLVAGSQLALVAAENLDHHFYEKKSEGSFGRTSFRSDTVTRVTQQGTEIETGGDLTLVSGSDQLHQASQLTSGADLTLSSGGSVVFEGVLDLHQESHEKSKSSWAWQSAKGQGNNRPDLDPEPAAGPGRADHPRCEGVQIDVREINQQTVSQTIDAMVAAEPGLAWLKEMEARGDVDWRHVKEVHDSFSYSHSGLGAGAQLVIAIVVAAMVGPGASALAGGGTAGR